MKLLTKPDRFAAATLGVALAAAGLLAAAADSNGLNGVRCPSPNDCWTAGDRQKSGGSEFNQLLRWKGTKWVTG